MRRVAFVSWGSLILVPALAAAQPSLTVLGLTAIDGDDEIAETLTTMLRRAADESPNVRLLPREVQLGQMVLAFDCEEPPDRDCLLQIGDQMETDRLAYGYVRRRRPTGDRLEVRVLLFDVRSGESLGRVDETIPPVLDDVDDLRVPARRIMGRLLGESQAGTLRILADVAGAVARVDGRDVGAVGDTGLETNVPAGTHRVEVTRDGHRTHLETVEVAPGQTTEVRATLEATASDVTEVEEEEGGGPRIDYPAWGLIGGGALLAGIGLYFTVVTAARNGESGEFYRLRADHPGSPDVCAEPDLTPDEQDLCDTASLQSTLQFVFYGAAAVAGGIGLYLLLGDASGETEVSTTALRVDPALWPGGGAVLVSGALP